MHGTASLQEQCTTTPPHTVPNPTIRLISATPSATGSSLAPSPTLGSPWVSIPSTSVVSSPLAPKPHRESEKAVRKRLVPKKSKLRLLSSVGVNVGSKSSEKAKEKDRAKDLSDVVRRLGVPSDSASVRDGFEIYVDPRMDDEISEIILIKKKKSRLGLDGMRWGGGLGDVTNVPRATAQPKEMKNSLLSKVKENEGVKEGKWWSIGRGRKLSKEKEKDEQSRNKLPDPASSTFMARDPYPRSKTPEPLKLSEHACTRARFNSLDPGILLAGAATSTGLVVDHAQTLDIEAPQDSPSYPTPLSRAPTPTQDDFVAPPGAVKEGSIALRAMRSVKSLARIKSWAMLRNGGDENTTHTVKEKKTKEEGNKRKKSSKVSSKPEVNGENSVIKKSKSSSSKKTVKPAKKDVAKEKESTQTLRLSTSSFEVGSPSPMRPPLPPSSKKKTLKKKQSFIGLGLPGSIRLPSIRSGSTSSNVVALNPPRTSSLNYSTIWAPNDSSTPTNAEMDRISIESARTIFPVQAQLGRDRVGSLVSTSTNSSLRPISTKSCGSRVSSNNSVKWDEGCIKNGQEIRQRERSERKASSSSSEIDEGKARRRKASKSSERASEAERAEGRRRMPLSEVLSFLNSGKTDKHEEQLPLSAHPEPPTLTVESTTSDGQRSFDDDDELYARPSYDDGIKDMLEPLNHNEENTDEQKPKTPVEKPRARPLSDQLSGKSRPLPMYEGEDGVMSILDAATNDLAQLINRLDLEATPNTHDITSLRPMVHSPPDATATTYGINESPTKFHSNKPQPLHPQPSAGTEIKAKNPHQVPLTVSIRPYAQSRKKMLTVGPSVASLPKMPTDTTVSETLIGRQIAPWPTLLENLSPAKAASSKGFSKATPAKSSKMTHKRTPTPSPEPEPSPVFYPLRPATLRTVSGSSKAPSSSAQDEDGIKVLSEKNNTAKARSHSFSTLLEPNTSSEMPSPVFKRASPGQVKSWPSWAPLDIDAEQFEDNDTVPIPPGARRILGMSLGTMGGSDVSHYDGPELDSSDPDSDIPEELQTILLGQNGDGDTLSYQNDCVLAPTIGSGSLDIPSALPKFQAQLIDEGENHADIESSDDENTKKSFDFTGEIKKLNESSASDRKAFMEQLENAFRTPAKVNFKGFSNAFLTVDAPPVPKLPVHLQPGNGSQVSNDAEDPVISNVSEVKEPSLLGASTTTMESFGLDESLSSVSLKAVTDSQIVAVKEHTLLPVSDSFASSDKSHEDNLSESLKSSTRTRPSDGKLNTSFRFGGLPSPSQQDPTPQADRQDKLSDVDPPPSRMRSLSTSSVLEDDSVLNLIYAKASGIPQPRIRLNSDSSAKRRTREGAMHYRHSRHSSGFSFQGFDSFDEVRRGFEFKNEQPFYPPPVSHRKNNPRDSLLSIASVSSYGKAHDYGLPDPFDYGLPSLRERPSSEDLSVSMSMSVDDTFSFLVRQPRNRVESDASSFYFRAPMQSSYNRHRDSGMSSSSQAPPVSLYNRGFGNHRRNESSSSAYSVAHSYAMHGASGGRAAWAHHRFPSVDSVNSDFSMMRLGRPGIGDKMFDTAVEHEVPPKSASASPTESTEVHIFSSMDYDSIIDDDQQSSTESSLFEKADNCSSIPPDSVFRGNEHHPGNSLVLQPKYRPLSMLSMNVPGSPAKDDDTMISMLGGGYVRRRSVVASPCPRVEKRKYSALQTIRDVNTEGDYEQSPNKARIVEKPSIASTTSFKFGDESMIKPRHGLLERQGLEESVLVAEGEDLTNSFRNTPIFTRPGPASRSRSSTCTSSSVCDTPPLSASDGFSSMDEGSQSSLDLSHVDLALTNLSLPITGGPTRVRSRARGHGHRRRASHARAARSSVYETIEEERSILPSPPNHSTSSQKSSPTTCQPIFIVEPDSVEESPDHLTWDDDSGITTLRKFYALRDEAQTTVVESKRTWHDTPLSLYAVKSFDPPRHPTGMWALLEHSVQNFGPLPSVLRPRRVRSRTSSRASPYPQPRVSKAASPPPPEPTAVFTKASKTSMNAAVLQNIPVNHNAIPTAPFVGPSKPFFNVAKDVEPKRENSSGLTSHTRPRIGLAARKNALGLAKRSNVKLSTDQKENAKQGMTMTPSDTLRLNRPRPRGRPTPVSAAKPIRV